MGREIEKRERDGERERERERWRERKRKRERESMFECVDVKKGERKRFNLIRNRTIFYDQINNGKEDNKVENDIRFYWRDFTCSSAHLATLMPD